MLNEKACKTLEFCYKTKMEDLEECVKFAKGVFPNCFIRKILPSNAMEVKKLSVLDYDDMLEYEFNSYGVEVTPHTLLVGKEGISKYYYHTKRLGLVGQYIQDKKNGVFVDIRSDGSFGSVRFYKNGRLSRRYKEVSNNGAWSRFFVLGFAFSDFSFNGNASVFQVKEAWESTKRYCV